MILFVFHQLSLMQSACGLCLREIYCDEYSVDLVRWHIGEKMCTVNGWLHNKKPTIQTQFTRDRQRPNSLGLRLQTAFPRLFPILKWAAGMRLMG